MLQMKYGLSHSIQLRPSCVLLSGLRYPQLLYNPPDRSVRLQSTSSASKDVAVLGGGITGLASAYYLSQSLPSARITIYEAKPRLGGWLSSKRVDIDDGSILFEAGPRTLRPNGNGVLAVRLSNELGLADDTVLTSNSSPAATNRYVYYPDHLVRVPNPRNGLWSVLSTLFGESAFEGIVWSIGAEKFQEPRDDDVTDESIGEFVTRRLGHKAADRIVSAVMHGIYAGDIWQLSAKSLMTTQWRYESKYGSIVDGVLKNSLEGLEMDTREVAFAQAMRMLPKIDDTRFLNNSVFTFRDGLSQLTERLVEKLRGISNVKFCTNTAIRQISMGPDQNISLSLGEGLSSSASDRTADQTAVHTQVISTLSPAHLGSVVGDSSCARPLSSIPSATVMTVNLYYRTPGLHPPGFGYLIPLGTSFEQNPERALGVVFDTDYSPGPDNDLDYFHGPPQDTVTNRGTKVTVMLGGHYWAHWPVYPSEQEGLDLARSILKRHLGIVEEPAAHLVNLQKDCIPQYTVGHSDRLRAANEGLLRDFGGRLRVAGNWARGVGVNDCIRSAWDLARDFQDDRRTGLEAAVEEKTWVRVKPDLTAVSHA